MRQKAQLIVILLTFYYNLNASAALLPFPTTLPKVNTAYDSILLKTWQGIKKRNIDPHTTKLVHRPKSEYPNDAVSEGAGYGMLVALYCNDQLYFNKIWDAAESSMWKEKYYDWWVDKNGDRSSSPSFQGAATDAEIDIALALIFADQLVKKGTWQAHKSPNDVSYAQRADTIINNIWTLMVENGIYLRPGANWGGMGFVNPGYFAPAFFRVFDEFETTDHNWQGLIDQCYTTIAASKGYEKGFVPDWMNPNGAFVETTTLGYNAYAGGQFLYKDAIRIYWRIATDYLWYNDPRAKTFLTKAMTFLDSPQKADFFQMNGDAVTDSFTLGDKSALYASRPRKEHSHLTTGMWACAAIAVGSQEIAEQFSDELLKFYTPGADFWGKVTDPNGEDTLHNEMYFDQFLAWFGASLLSGVFTNVWEDMKDPNPEITLAWKKEPILNTNDINASITPFIINGTFTKKARWTVELVHNDKSDTRAFSGSGESLFVNWNGLSAEGLPMSQGWYKVTISAKGLNQPIIHDVWLGKAFDLMEKNRLIVDDFRDADLTPFIGSKWTSYLDNHDRPGTKTAVKDFSVKTVDAKQWLNWSFHLEGSSVLGFDPYAALEWNCTTPEGNLDLSGLDTIVVTAKAQNPLSLSVQIITSDISDYTYFEDSLTLTSTSQEYSLPISGFKQRLNGSGKTLDLSKVKGIRFQIQATDNTENILLFSKISFSGNLSQIYKAPPEYIPLAVKKHTASRNSFNVRYALVENGIQFTLPHSTKMKSQILLFDTNGRSIARATMQKSEIFIPLTHDRLANKLLFAQIIHNGKKNVIPISIVR
jgi:endo-1,4-beta-D-glucanase Y